MEATIRYRRPRKAKGPPKKWKPGDTHNSFTLIRSAGDGYWYCQCSCGTMLTTTLGKRDDRCGKCKPSKFKFAVGQKVGKLTLMEAVGKGRWICQCQCGKVIKTCPGAHSSCLTCKDYKSARPKGPQLRVLPDLGRSLDPVAIRLKGNYRSAFYNARNKNIAFTITFEDYLEIVKKPCEYCGHELPRTGSGLDRVVCSEGYEKHNVVPCCTVCNRVKSDTFRFREMKVLGPFLRRLLNARPSPVQGSAS